MRRHRRGGPVNTAILAALIWYINGLLTAAILIPVIADLLGITVNFPA